MSVHNFDQKVTRILLVEDETSLGQILEQSLRDFGYEVLGPCATGADAVRIALQAGPSLILMDIGLSGDMDGIDAYSEIRSHMDVPVVYLTGHTETYILERATKTEPYGYVNKTISPAELKFAVETVLNRFEADKRVRRSEEKYRTLVETVPHGIGEIDLFGNLIQANDAYGRMYGYSAEEISGKSILDMQISPSRANHLREYLALVTCQRPDPSPWISRERTKEGKLIDVRIDWNYQFDNYGILKGFYFVITDITELVQREEALAKADERFRKAEELAGLGSWEWDIGTGKLIWSEESFRTFGFDSLEVVPTLDLFLQCIHPDDKTMVQAAIADALSGTRPYDVEFRIVTPDGTLRLLHSRGDIVRDSQGRPERMLGTAMDITQRRKAEKALLEQEALIRSISDNLPSGMIYQVVRHDDGTRKFLYLSERVRDFYGCSPENAMNDSNLIYGKVHPEDRHRVFCEEERAHETLSVFRSEVRMIDPCGDIRWSYFASSPKRLEDGSTYWSGLEIDITQLKKVEEALIQSEIRYRQAVEHSPNAIFAVNPEGRIVSWNPACETILGYTGDAALGNDLSTLVSTSDQSNQLADMLCKVFRGDSFSGVQLDFCSQSGVVRNMISRAYPLVDAQGNVVECMFANTDVTEIKAAEETLIEHERWMSSVFAALQESVVILTPERIVKDFNPATSRMFGYTKEEVVGRSASIFHVDQAHNEEFQRRILKAFEKDEFAEFEFELKRKNGEIFPSHHTLSLLRDRKGDPIGIAGVTRDITGLKKAEADLKASLNEKEVLLQELHHRVKNNLQLMLSLLRMQSRKIEDPSTLDALRETENRIMSIALVHEKLYRSQSLSTIEIGHYLKALTNHVVQVYQGAQAGIDTLVQVERLTVSIDTAVPLGMIVTELISNSLKHAFPNRQGGKIGVNLRVLDDDLYELSVSDNGIGIDDRERKSSRKSLGLELVRTLTAQLDGTLDTVRSGGTVTRVRFRDVSKVRPRMRD